MTNVIAIASTRQDSQQTVIIASSAVLSLLRAPRGFGLERKKDFLRCVYVIYFTVSTLCASENFANQYNTHELKRSHFLFSMKLIAQKNGQQQLADLPLR